MGRISSYGPMDGRGSKGAVLLGCDFDWGCDSGIVIDGVGYRSWPCIVGWEEQSGALGAVVYELRQHSRCSGAGMLDCLRFEFTEQSSAAMGNSARGEQALLG